MKSGIRAMLLQPWFVITALLALTHQVLQRILNVQNPFIDSFLDPLLFMPMLLHLILLERRFVFGLGTGYVLSWQHIVGIVILISFICEVLFPRWSSSFTSDYKDVICYSFGGAVFVIFFNSPIAASDVK